MQWVAMITMLIDHIGAIFFPHEIALRIIGRISFPLYVYLMVIGYYRTRSFSKYIVRLAILAVVSQLPYQYAFDTTRLNVIATLLVCILTIRLLDLKSFPLFIRYTVAITSIILLEVLSFDYGAYALVLMLIYRYLQPSTMLINHFAAEVFFLIYNSWLIQFFSMVVTYFIVFQPRIINTLNLSRAPSLLWRSFYPLHLIIIVVISYLM